jgi:putative drug exporter of the RND superfamily
VRRIASFVAGRRGKWIVLGAWVIAFFGLFQLGSKLADQTTDDTESFLPKSAESTKVVRALDQEFPGGETDTGLIVYKRDGGLEAADKQQIATDAVKVAAAKQDVPLTAPPQTPFGPGGAPVPGLVSPDGSVAYTVLTVPTDFDKEGDQGKAVRDLTGTGTEANGLQVQLTGGLGFSADAKEVFGSLDATLLAASALLVLILLGFIYRAVLAALTPLIVVFFAYTVAQGFIYLFAKSGATVSSNSTSILVVLMFGVGTDYCLLLVSRYREELRVQRDKHQAMQRAVRRVGPAIFASGLTVALSMLVLTLADSGNTRSLGPVAAIGVGTACLAGLTLLPALLTIFGRAAFWPRRGIVDYDPAHPSITRQGLWRRFGDRVLARPVAALTVTVLAFVAGAFGLLAYKVDYSTTSFFKNSVESISGFKTLQSAFPAGTLAPTTVLVESDEGPVTEAQTAETVKRLEGVDGVASAAPTGLVSNDKRTAEIDVILEGDPLKKAQLDVVPEMRAAVDDIPGATVLVGGSTAINYDLDKTTSRDLKLIAPIALLVIAIILGILLRSLVAPVLLIASVVLSFLCTIGLSVLFIRYVVGDPGMDASIPTFAFIFLVALGIDYTIFLMARVREESREHGTREGMLRAIAATGPVITSAGIILAGTFSVLMTLPVTFTFDLGLMVALGILLDTFVVRSIMVPAAVEILGDKVWWPSTAQGGSALGEDLGSRDAAAPPARS